MLLQHAFWRSGYLSVFQRPVRSRPASLQRNWNFPPFTWLVVKKWMAVHFWASCPHSIQGVGKICRKSSLFFIFLFKKIQFLFRESHVPISHAFVFLIHFGYAFFFTVMKCTQHFFLFFQERVENICIS